MAVNLVSFVGDTERATEHTCTTGEIRQWKTILTRSIPRTASLKRGPSSDTYFIFKITEVAQHRENETPIFTDAVYSYSQERIVGMRIYPQGVGSGRGTHVALFIHMIKGDFDNSLVWPFRGTVTISVLDQSCSRDQSDISRIIQVKPNLTAFQQPREAICRTGYGFKRFAPIEKFFGPQYVKDGELLLKIEFSG
ncbi:TNF receptor-associated factor 6-like [Montipora foliosa]|uniref:TNF receptor-associated factor 6-like n=1 Tax=Montipora foliosa TaxID=591990 RepID=UPI0035F1FC6B